MHTTERFTGQVSIFARYSTLKFTPDQIPDILYNGVSQAADKSDLAGGLQAEGAYHLGDQHTLRVGLIVEVDRTTSQTTSAVLLVDNDPSSPGFGAQIGDQPFTINDNGAKTAETYSAYVQDEWKLAHNLTLNYGLRFDQFDGFRVRTSSARASMRSGTRRDAVHDHPCSATRAIFLPAAIRVDRGRDHVEVRRADGDSVDHIDRGAGGDHRHNALAPKRADYFPDAGRRTEDHPEADRHLRQLLQALQASDRRRPVRRPIILTPFNYASGRARYGVELTAAYNKGRFSAYANFAYSKAQARDWISSQFNFDQASLDYVAAHDIFLDHDETYAASAGASYLWMGTRFGLDLIYGSGLRADQPLKTPVTFPDGSVLTAIPNGEELPAYAQVNLSLSHRFDTAPTGPYEVRFDVINLFDSIYQIRNGSGVGVFAPQFGPRRGLFFGLSKEFG